MVSSIAAVSISTSELMGERQAAQFLENKIPVRTLQHWRRVRTGPAWLKIGRHVLYKKSDLESFLAESRVDPAA